MATGKHVQYAPVASADDDEEEEEEPDDHNLPGVGVAVTAEATTMASRGDDACHQTCTRSLTLYCLSIALGAVLGLFLALFKDELQRRGLGLAALGQLSASVASSPAGNPPPPLPEFGFIFPRCVKTPTHNELWREIYRNLRAHFPTAPILIIDDHSDVALVDQGFNMTGATVIASELAPGKGEVLPYHYFHQLKPFRKAVMLNDGMFILQPEPMRSAIRNTSDVRFLWHFESAHDYDYPGQVHLIQTALRPEVRARIDALRLNTTAWVGCFASASIMTWDFLDHLNATYGFLNMVDAIENRSHRMGLERLVALTAMDATGGLRPLAEVSLYGSIHAHRKAFTYSWADYRQDQLMGTLQWEPAVKVWNGRRRRRRRS